MGIIKNLISDWKTWRRGEKRVAPHGSTGRVYEKRKPKPPSGVNAASAEPVLTLKMKVMRADGNVEYHEAPAEMVKLGDKTDG